MALEVKNQSIKAGNIMSREFDPGSGRPPREGHGNPLQDSCLENPMDRGAWAAAVCGAAVRHAWATKQQQLLKFINGIAPRYFSRSLNHWGKRFLPVTINQKTYKFNSLKRNLTYNLERHSCTFSFCLKNWIGIQNILIHLFSLSYHKSFILLVIIVIHVF